MVPNNLSIRRAPDRDDPVDVRAADQRSACAYLASKTRTADLLNRHIGQTRIDGSVEHLHIEVSIHAVEKSQVDVAVHVSHLNATVAQSFNSQSHIAVDIGKLGKAGRVPDFKLAVYVAKMHGPIHFSDARVAVYVSDSEFGRARQFQYCVMADVHVISDFVGRLFGVDAKARRSVFDYYFAIFKIGFRSSGAYNVNFNRVAVGCLDFKRAVY